jgi:putative RecB family exonuclease
VSFFGTELDDEGQAPTGADGGVLPEGSAEAADALVEAAVTGEMPPGRPPYLSPSSAGTFKQCNRRWQLRYLERLPDPPGESALAGTFAHRVLELLFQHPAHERTLPQAKLIARDVWPDTEADPHFQALGLDDAAARAFRWRGWKAIEGLWAVEEPTQVDVRATERLVDTTVGGVPFRGVVDRLDHHEGRLVVTDYKSGKAPSARFADDRLGQVLLYAAAVEAIDGERPAVARLVYLGQRVIDVAVTDAVITPVLDSLAHTWQAIDEACDSGHFEPTPGPLCGWCPYVERCPEGQAEVERRRALFDPPPLFDDIPLAG